MTIKVFSSGDFVSGWLDSRGGINIVWTPHIVMLHVNCLYC